MTLRRSQVATALNTDGADECGVTTSLDDLRANIQLGSKGWSDMPSQQRMTTKLKELFERPEIFVLAGGMNPMGAKMAEVLGFEAFYMSGGNTSAHLLGWTEGGTSMRDMVDNARRIVNTVDIPVFADMDTGYGDAITVFDTVKEYIRAGIAGTHLEDQTYPPKSGPRRRCVSIAEMVGKLRAAMDAKMELDPDFVIVARCDYAGVPGSTFEEVMERCLAYKRETNVDVVCPAVQSWEENKEAINRIPGPVLPLFSHGSQTHPTLEELQAAGAAAAWYPSLTTMAGLQASWDLLNDFKERGTSSLDDFLARAAQSKWGAASNGSILGAQRIREMEDKYLP